MISLFLLAGCAGGAAGDTDGAMILGATSLTAALLGAGVGLYGLWRQLRGEERVDRLEATVGELNRRLEAVTARRQESTPSAPRVALRERPEPLTAQDRTPPERRPVELRPEAPRREEPRRDDPPREERASDQVPERLDAVAPVRGAGELSVDDRIVEVSGDLDRGGGAGPAAREVDVGEREEDGSGAGAAEPAGTPERAQPRPDDEARRWLDSLRSRPYGEVAGALGALYLQSRQLGRLMRDTNAGAFFRLEIEQAVPQRLQRLAQLRPNAHPSQVQEWVEVDLLPTLDALARILSAAAVEQREGHAPAAVVYEAIADALYVQLHAACVREGWFGIPTIRPYETDFDPRIHQAVGNRAEPGAANRIVEIRKMGRIDARTSAVLAPAHVVVGR